MLPVVKIAELIIQPQHLVAEQRIFQLVPLILKLLVELSVRRGEQVIHRLDIVLRDRGRVGKISAAKRNVRVRVFGKAGYCKGEIRIVILFSPTDNFTRKQRAADVGRSELFRFPLCAAMHNYHSGLAVIREKYLGR